MIWFAIPVSIVLAMIYPNIDASSIDFPEKFWSKFILPFNMVAIPLVLWGIAVIRKAKKIA